MITGRGGREYFNCCHLITFPFPSTLPNLTSHSVEVNIGIITACLPTLLPLYRILRDKNFTTRQGFTSATSRFKQLFSGQERKPNLSLHEAFWRPQRESVSSIPQNAEWASSTSQTFIRRGKAGDEDVEMQTQIVRSQ